MLNFLEKEYYTFYKKKNDNTNIIDTKFYTPSLIEWNNNIYNFNKNKSIKNIYIKDSLISKLLKSYFNIKKIKFWKNRKLKFSIMKVFLGKQYISHINNKIYITLCVYNKDKISLKKYILSFYNKIFLISKKNYIRKNFFKRKSLSMNFIMKAHKLYLKRIYVYRNNLINKNFFYSIEKNNNIYVNKLLNYIINKNLLITKYFIKKCIKFFIIKKRIIRLKFMNYKYNINNFLGVKNILYKIYNKEIEFNIINLKYLYLDSNILNEAIGKKLKNRKNNLLKNIVKAITKVKIPYRYKYEKNNLYDFKSNNIILFLNPNLQNKNTGSVKKYMYTSTQRLGIVLYNLKYKSIRGIKVQGTGRLTKRLTALRSVSKVRQKGSLRNTYSCYHSVSSIMLLGYLKSNLQYIKKNYSNRNGSYGIKTQISTI